MRKEVQLPVVETTVYGNLLLPWGFESRLGCSPVAACHVGRSGANGDCSKAGFADEDSQL